MSPNTNGLFPFPPSALPPSLSSSRVAGLHQETQHQLPRLGRVSGACVCVYVLVCASACEISVNLSQRNAVEEALCLD